MKKINRGLSSNLLRVLATLFVFLLHGRGYIPKIEELPDPLNWLTFFPAWAGVWIFLFLSGYSIGCGFFTERYLLTDENGKIKLRYFIKFYLGRFFRIASLYYFYCTIFEILSGNLYFWNNRMCLIKMLTFTFNGNGGIGGVGHLWYVSMAMQLYLFMPFLYLLLRCFKDKKIYLMVLYAVTVAFGLILRCGIVNVGFEWYTYSYTNCFVNLDLIIVGYIVAEIKVTYRDSFASHKYLKYFAALIFACLVIYNCYIYQNGSSYYMYIYQCILPSAYAASCGLLVFLSGNGNTSQKCLWFSKIVDWFAGYSYSFYILHIAVFEYFNLTLLKNNLYMEAGVFVQYFIFFAASFIVILILAIPFHWIGNKFVEKYRAVERKVLQ